MTPRSTTLAALLLSAATLHGCLAAQLKQPTMRVCAEQRAVVEHCKADASCTAATLTNTHGETYGVLEAFETNAEQACATHRAVTGAK